MFLAISMGSSGTAPAFSVAYGANIIRKSFIPGLFGIMVFSGAILAGKATATTMGQDLVNPDLLNFVLVSIVLFSVSISLLVANLSEIPQSTSQLTVLTLLAPAIYYHQFNAHKLFYEIIPTWFILPIISYIICLLIGRIYL